MPVQRTALERSAGSLGVPIAEPEISRAPSRSVLPLRRSPNMAVVDAVALAPPRRYFFDDDVPPSGNIVPNRR